MNKRTELETMKTMLRSLGADYYDLLLPETHVLPTLLHSDERVTGIVYGRYSQPPNLTVGRGALVATTKRVLLVDKKPAFLKCDEITYFVISGVSRSNAGIAATVTLHTRIGDIHIKTLNKRCANGFVNAVEANIFTTAATTFPPAQTQYLNGK